MKSCSTGFVLTTTAMVIASLSVLGTEPVSSAELVGTWRIEPTSIKIVERVTPNFVDRPKFLTNSNAFALILKTDGSFVATNVPAGFFFFDLPAMAESTGKWSVTTNWFPRERRKEENAYSEFNLYFTTPSNHYWSRPIGWSRNELSTSRKFEFPISGWDKTKTYDWFVRITKQD